MENFLAPWRPQLLSVLRIMAGLLLTAHGTAKLLAFPTHPPFNNVASGSPSWYAAFFELILGPLLALGLFTRPVAFILSGLAAVAYFYAHAPRSFHPLVNGGELAVLYSFVLIYIAAAGPGAWSLDGILRKKS
jgi:putative oxidoreductase